MGQRRAGRLARLALGLAILVALVFLAGFFLATPPRPDGFPVSPVLLDRDGRALFVGLSGDDELVIPTALADMGEYLPLVAVGVEDKRFYGHPGVDPLALARAVAQNLWARRVVSGASTITVQLVRLSEPRPRNAWSKLVEFFQALRLERELGKDEILELYLNRAPFGGNVRGVGAAAWAYFGKKPAELSLGESALLVALLRGPSVYRPDRWPDRARDRRDLVLSLLEGKGLIASEQGRRARLEPVGGPRVPPPREAPHLAARLLSRADGSRWRWGAPGFWGQPTTIDPASQENLERSLLMALAPFPGEVNGAGLLVDSRDGRVLAYVGGVRREGPAFMVDNLRSRRSPGSTLKPFVYLAAFGEGTLVPASLLADTPLDLQGQAPRNFDQVYRGPVPAGRALAESLNAPAVRVLRMVGEDKALAILRRAGIPAIPGRSYGDSLVLGGLEATAMELAGAYASLAAGGKAIRPSLDPGVSGQGPRLFSPEAVWLVNQSLADSGRLPLGLSGEGLAFKSGTSNDLRDAWLAIYDRSHTLVIWLGDPEGRGHEGLSGMSALAEAGFQFMRDLGRRAAWPGPPQGLERYMACPLSGEPASPFCPGARWAWRIKALARTHSCQIHRRRDGRLVTVWPKELARFMGANESLSGPKAMGPQVVSPGPGAVVVLGDRDVLPLKSEGTVGQVHWYLDGRFVATSESWAAPVISPGYGSHWVSVMDSRDMTARSSFTVVSRESVGGRGAATPILAFD
ncbi:MAG: penicillin-binding protein 1C [Deltaproteobacteria bacterium]|jgi:penicillin-binding protein 1C|nr:penicillin-binding protein 1C [Deltaproteobacteria bacterium]